MRPSPPGPPAAPAAPSPGGAATALARGVDLAVRTLSVHGTRPWLLEVHTDRLLVRADRSRQRPVPDRAGRALVQSVGAALIAVRVGLAAEGWSADVDRLPDPGDPDLLAVIRSVAAVPDAALAALAALAPAVFPRPGGRPASGGPEAPDELLATLAAAAADEDVQLVPVRHESQRRLVAHLAGQAAPSRHPAGRTMVLLATASDTPFAWLRSGEAVQRVRLELARRRWSARPVPQVIDVPLARTQLRSALAWDAHPQLLLRLGQAASPDRPTRDQVQSGFR